MGRMREVLYERAVGEGIYEGHTTNYMKVHGRSEADLTNRIAKTHITRAEGEMLFGDVEGIRKGICNNYVKENMVAIELHFGYHKDN